MAPTRTSQSAISPMLLVAGERHVSAVVSKLDGLVVDWVPDLERAFERIGREGDRDRGDHELYRLLIVFLDGAAEGATRPRAMAAVGEHLPDIPIIALVSSPRMGAIGLSSGAHGFALMDRFDRQQFDQATAHAIELHRARRALGQTSARLDHANRLSSIGQLTAGVVHEINNPTASLLANLTVMREQVLGMRDSAADAGSDRIGMAGQLGEWVDIIDESIASIAHVRSIVRELRNFSRTEGSTVGRVDLNRVVDDACKLTESVIRKRARLVKRLGAVSKIRGDHGKLVQVVTNLLTNAAQAIAGQVADNEIRVSTAERDGLIIAAVEDTGCGIPEGASKLVFEPFFTTKPRDVGNGLGLALSAEIVDGHGGELGFAPVAGGGTRFEVRLPVDRQVAGDTLELHRPVRLAPRAQVAAGPRSRVLLIDDEPSLLRAFRRLLSPYHEVVMAATGQQALDILIRDSAFDGIICDFALPDVDGIAIYENVAARDRELAERIVFCTGGPLSGRSRVFIESTRNTVLEKPVPPEVLIGAIEQLGTR